jgi:type IV secretion system protein VirB2
MKSKLVWFLSVFVPSFVFGAGLTKVNDLMAQVETALHGVAVTVITVAAMYVGFKVMYQKQALADFWYVILGAIIFAAAAELAAWFV